MSAEEAKRLKRMIDEATGKKPEPVDTVEGFKKMMCDMLGEKQFSAPPPEQKPAKPKSDLQRMIDRVDAAYGRKKEK